MGLMDRRLTAKHSTTDDVSNQSRDNALPDIQAHADLGRPQPDGHGNKGHVGDNVIETHGHESKNRPPDPHQLRGDITTLYPQEATHADEPVAPDGTQEYHVEVGGDLFFVCVGNNFRLVRLG